MKLTDFIAEQWTACCDRGHACLYMTLPGTMVEPPHEPTQVFVYITHEPPGTHRARELLDGAGLLPDGDGHAPMPESEVVLVLDSGQESVYSDALCANIPTDPEAAYERGYEDGYENGGNAATPGYDARDR